MSSGFVSSGAIIPDDPADEPSVSAVLTSSNAPSSSITDNNNNATDSTAIDSWAAADAAVKLAKENAAKQSSLTGSQDDGKTLYDVLQANKARKQEEFEEKLKFKNQFRSLDEGEIEFLDTIVSEQRAEEEAKKREIEARLDDFRKLQYEADHDATSLETPVVDEPENTWAVSARRKRKKEKEKQLAGSGVKLRKLSDGSRRESIGELADEKAVSRPGSAVDSKSPVLGRASTTKLPLSPTVLAKSPTAAIEMKKDTVITSVKKGAVLAGGLVAYGSDSEDDD